MYAYLFILFVCFIGGSVRTYRCMALLADDERALDNGGARAVDAVEHSLGSVGWVNKTQSSQQIARTIAAATRTRRKERRKKRN